MSPKSLAAQGPNFFGQVFFGLPEVGAQICGNAGPP